MSRRLFIIAGEKSGDLLGSHLIAALKAAMPGCAIEGVGGAEMRSEGFDCFMRTEEFEVMGFSEIIKAYPKLRRQYFHLLGRLAASKPDAVIFIDYPGFNLKLAGALRKQGFAGKLIQYVSPTVWAWGRDRIAKMESSLDLLLSIYPFEKAHFEGSSLQVKYVGNPIKEIISKHHYNENWAALCGIKETDHLIAIFPGSRLKEIQLNLSYQLKAAELLKQEDASIRFVISCAHEKIMSHIHGLLQTSSLKINQDLFFIPKAYTYELMRSCRSALAKSGTVNLELALHKCPTVVSYKLTWLNRLAANYYMRLNLPHYCIVNILMGKTVYPELIAKGVSPQAIFRSLSALTGNTAEREECMRECEKLHEILKEDHASINAAHALEELLS